MPSKQGYNGSVKSASLLKLNWASILSVVVSLAALVVSIQANLYSRRAVTSNIRIDDWNALHGAAAADSWALGISGCYDDRGSSQTYRVEIETGPGELWISNAGGLDVTLIAVDFASNLDIQRGDITGFRNVWATDIYKWENPVAFSAEDQIYTLDIPAGKAARIRVLTNTWLRFPTAEDAIGYYHEVLSDGSLDKYGIWFFKFSDGKVVTRKFPQASVSFFPHGPELSESFEEQVKLPCK